MSLQEEAGTKAKMSDVVTAIEYLAHKKRNNKEITTTTKHDGVEGWQKFSNKKKNANGYCNWLTILS